ncbi:MAG: SRPBCC family protein [Acidimicrobiales bacterium]
MTTERFDVEREIAADPATIFRLLCDPRGHVAIDSSGMLMDATGSGVTGVGDTFVVHMDRRALNDRPMGAYDVIVTITEWESERRIAWIVAGAERPSVGHVYGYTLEPYDGGTLVTSFYDWSAIADELKETGIFPVLSEAALRSTLGILARAVEPAPSSSRPA